MICIKIANQHFNLIIRCNNLITKCVILDYVIYIYVQYVIMYWYLSEEPYVLGLIDLVTCSVCQSR